jgi:hypothetical protein
MAKGASEMLTPLAGLCGCVAVALLSGVLRFQYPTGVPTPILDAMFLVSAACAIVALLWILSTRAKTWADHETDRALEEPEEQRP